MNKVEESKNQAPGQSKEVVIIVNAREKTVVGKEISFEDVVKLAFGSYEQNPDIVYSVSYSKGEDKKEGTMTPGSSVKVKEGMNFNVTKTNRS
jgi:hypothetical protein